MPHYRLVVEYDGTDFSGWQSQINGRAVQDVVESAIAQVCGERVRIAGAGRTDAGVHAEGQVVSFTLTGDREPVKLQRSLNGVLPDDVVVRSCDSVPDGFHARFSAKARTYRYDLVTRPVALDRRRVWSVHWALDQALLHRCALMVLGEHDFRSFARTGSEVSDWKCIVTTSSWGDANGRLSYRITANRFLYGMVRALVGTMIEIARGYRRIEEFEAILAARDRREAGMAAPPGGLYLERVDY